jgi:RNA polymerase sigma-70 factor (ECF subfamily)
MDSSTERAFLELYDTMADDILRYCYFRVPDREVAKDLAQDIFLRLWDYLKQGKQVVSMRAFLYRTARNIVIDHYRKKKSMSLEILQEKGFDPTGEDHLQIESLSAGKEAMRATAHLDDRSREVVLLRYANNLSLAEVAEIVGESENAVSVRLHRATKKLKDILEHGTN